MDLQEAGKTYLGEEGSLGRDISSETMWSDPFLCLFSASGLSGAEAPLARSSSFHGHDAL